MDGSVNPVSQPSAADPATAEASVSTNNAPTGSVSGATRINSLEHLRQIAPQVYNQMMISLATTMMKDMNDHQQRLKEMWQKARNDTA